LLDNHFSKSTQLTAYLEHHNRQARQEIPRRVNNLQVIIALQETANGVNSKPAGSNPQSQCRE
jgi:UTP-glucose-1-phosphate uridylyltransferase